jgi:hypothetical protein
MEGGVSTLGSLQLVLVITLSIFSTSEIAVRAALRCNFLPFAPAESRSLGTQVFDSVLETSTAQSTL